MVKNRVQIITKICSVIWEEIQCMCMYVLMVRLEKI